MEKKKVIFASVAVVLCLTVIIGVIVLKNHYQKSDLESPKKDEQVLDNENIQLEDVFVVISINPKLMLKINDNRIIEIYQLNDDSIIFTNDKLKGLEVDKGIEKIIDILKENNYITNDTEVKLSLYENTDDKDNVIDTIKSKFSENNIKTTFYTINNQESEEIKNIVTNYKEQVKKYIVTFNSNGGSVVDSQTIEENKKVTKPSNPTRNGFAFLGWYYNDNQFDFNTEITSDLTLIAQWKENMTEKEITAEESISYTTKEVQEANMLRGTKTIAQTGKVGKKKVTYKVVYNSQGKEVSRTKISENIVEQPTEEIVKIGVSDYNLNSDKITGWTHGYFCTDTKSFEQDGVTYKICATHNDNEQYDSISINNNKEYLTNFKSNQIRPLIFIGQTNNTEITSALINGTKYYFEPGYGEKDTNNPLTEQDCTKYGLACGRW